MVNPSKHADHRGWIESVMRHIPGFNGYLEKEYRRESDHLARTHLADRLHVCKRGVNEFQRTLLDSGKLNDLPAMERVNSTLDTLINQIKGEVRGYSGLFDFVKIDEAVLQSIYEQDMQLISDVDSLVKQTESLSASDDPHNVGAQLQQQLEAIREKFSLRAKTLTGIEPSA